MLVFAPAWVAKRALESLFWVVPLGLSSPLWAAYVPCSLTPPQPKREIRAVWVATIANIDWPSTNSLTTAQQKAELEALLDRAMQLKLNTVIFQVRPACDALYASSIEPWSEYLTGTMGKAPRPFYDPLAFAVQEAHRRGLELHAWFNPYRARHALAKSPVAPSHISRTHRELVRRYGKSLWLDPGEKAVQEYVLQVVMDVVRRYDIDGVHFDDYFYPYPEADRSGREMDFPDEASWRRYGMGGKLDRADWRRENVNEFVHHVYLAIKAAKPWVKFGLSPFGIWRPGNPPSVRGFDAYQKLYADSRKWLANGWVDYFVPQLYWAIGAREQSFPALLRWWAEQNTQKRLLAPGMDCTKVGRLWRPEEIIDQVRLTRSEPGVSGQVLWNMSALMRSRALDADLERQVYAEPALLPPTPGLDPAAPDQPRLSVRGGGRRLEASWDAEKSGTVWQWLLQTRAGATWKTEILPRDRRSQTWSGAQPEIIAVRAVDRYGNTSKPAVLEGK
jgi:uncharacterized lipoprotein YddW (UPF0748 family)